MTRRAAVREWVPLVAVALIGMALRFWRLGALAVVGDESYFWLWSQHPALSYFEHPGGVAWLIGLSTTLSEGSELGVRWLNALLGVCSPLLIYGLGRRLLSPVAGLAATAILAVAPPYLVISRFVYTDTLPTFLLLLNLNLLWPIIGAPDGARVRLSQRRWLLIGLTWALLFNTKLSIYPYWLGLGIGVVLWRRHLLRDVRLWLTGLGASLGLLPFMVWNAAHQWGGVVWLWEHFTQGTVRASGPLSIVHHVFSYLSPPLVLLCLPGLLLWRTQGGRWLLLIALLLVMPVLLSPANSPRNLLVGCLPLIALTGAWLTAPSRRTRWRIGLLTALLAATALYGLGTTLALIVETSLPQSGVARAIRQDAAGWRALGPQLRSESGLLFAIDYSVASQLWYYSGRPAYTNWGQYLAWGIPDFTEATVVSLEYVPNERVERQMVMAFASVEGPLSHRVAEHGATKDVYLWRGHGLRVDKATFLQMFDFFSLYRAMEQRDATSP